MALRNFYHLTTQRSLASILNGGLQPRRGPRSRSYGESEERKAVYLFLEMWDALHAPDDMYGDEFTEELALLQVTLEEGAVQIEEEDNQAVSLTKITPGALEVVSVGLWGETHLSDKARVLSRLQYHVTPARNLKAILRDGLKARRGARSRKLGEDKGIFLFVTRTAAETGASNWLGDEFAEGTRLALLKVLVPPGVAIDFDEAVGYESRVQGDVGAAYLQVVTDNF